ncbi:hypothetical protein D3C72_2066310 [compost metagenome]
MHDPRRHHGNAFGQQRPGLAVEHHLGPSRGEIEELEELLVAVRGNAIIVQAAARLDGFPVQPVLPVFAGRFAVKGIGRDLVHVRIVQEIAHPVHSHCHPAAALYGPIYAGRSTCVLRSPSSARALPG